MSGLVAGVAGGVAVAGIAGAVISSNAQQDIAQSQLSTQQSTQQQALGYAKATPQELAAQKMQLDMANQSLKYAQDQMGQYALMQSQLSPTFNSAFGQIQSILAGNQTGYTSPYFKQLDIQRQQMNNRLQLAIGNGYGSSTAGLQGQALFAQQAGLGAMDVTQNSLAALMGVGQGTGQLITGLGTAGQNQLAAASTLNNQYAAMLSNIQGRQISALESTNVTPYAGASSVGAVGMGNALSSLGGAAYGGLNAYNASKTANAIASLGGSANYANYLGSTGQSIESSNVGSAFTLPTFGSSFNSGGPANLGLEA